MAVLSTLGLQKGRQQLAQTAPRTPLPPPRGSSAVQSEVQWV